MATSVQVKHSWQIPVELWKRLKLPPRTHWTDLWTLGCVLAISSERVVGYWVFTLGPTKRDIISQFTYVSPTYRKKKLAAKMWRYGLRHWKPHRLASTVVSEGGKGLVEKMEREFPKIRWNITEVLS